MAVDKNKVAADATRLVQKGHFDKAIKAYEKILAEDPRDVRVLLKIGELQQKKGDLPAAAATFGRVADAYAEQGFFLKAVAVYKQMLKLAPGDVRVNERLAGLYQQLGILSDALAQLQVVAAAAESSGDEARMLEVLRRMAELEPENVATAVRLGELFAKREQLPQALEQLRRAAEALRRAGRADEWVKVAERVAFLDPEDLALTRELADVYLAKGDTKRALAKLQLLFKADPRDLGTLTALAQAFRDLGQTAKTISVYKELARLQGDGGRAQEAATTWRRVLELAPDDADARAALGTPAAPAAPPARAPEPPRPPPAASPSRGAAPAARPAQPPRGGPESVSKLLTETDVYLKYGLHEKALEHLQRVFALDPDHLEAHEKALELRVKRADVDGAAAEAREVARIAGARGLAERVAAAAEKLAAIAPGHPALAELGGAAPPPLEATDDLLLVGEPDAVEGEGLLVEVEAPDDAEAVEIEDLDAAQEVPPPPDELALHAAGAGDDEIVEEEVAPPEAPPPPAEELAAPPPLAPAEEPMAPPPRPAPRARPAPIARIATAAPQPAVTHAPAPPPPAPALSAPSAARSAVLAPPPPPAPSAPAAPAAATRAPAPASARPTRPAPAAAPPPPPPPPPAAPEPQEEEDLDEELAEVGFLADQGLLDEAREALQNLLSFYPDHAKLRAAEAALARRTEAPKPLHDIVAEPVAGADHESTDELMNLTGSRTLGDDFGFSAEDVLTQFRRGVAETVHPEDSDTHYDLGIAYKEMGLLDDALRELEQALAGAEQKREIDILTMIALCRMEKGDPRGAAHAYQRALKARALTPEASRAIQYELAASYEAAGEREAALWYLQRVLAADAGYRDTRARVAALGGGAGRAPADADPRGGKNVGAV